MSFRSFCRDEHGTVALEYSLIVAVVVSIAAAPIQAYAYSLERNIYEIIAIVSDLI